MLAQHTKSEIYGIFFFISAQALDRITGTERFFKLGFLEINFLIDFVSGGFFKEPNALSRSFKSSSLQGTRLEDFLRTWGWTSFVAAIKQ
jgi:hypothetical protein